MLPCQQQLTRRLTLSAWSARLSKPLIESERFIPLCRRPTRSEAERHLEDPVSPLRGSPVFSTLPTATVARLTALIGKLPAQEPDDLLQSMNRGWAESLLAVGEPT
jgi:hypothetical protein